MKGLCDAVIGKNQKLDNAQKAK